MNAFIMVLKNLDKFSLVNGIGNIFMFLGKMTIASLTALLGFIMMRKWESIAN